MISVSFIQIFYFVLVLTIVMALAAFMTSRPQGRGLGSALLESGVWAGSLLACAGADYLLMVLNGNHLWGAA